MSARVISLLLFFLSLLTIRPLLQSGYFTMHDDLQVIRGYEMTACFNDGQIPCRWSNDMGYGYGYPQFNFYGPFPYYLQYLIHFLGFDLIASSKLILALALILAPQAMFILGSSLWGNWGGFISAVAYLFAPYRSSDIYSRGAMGETWAFVFLPLILYGINLVIKKSDYWSKTILGLSVAGLLISHNVSSLVFFPFASIYGLFLIWQTKNKKENIIKIITAVLLGIGISSFFILPVAFEKSYAHTESMISGYFNYLAHFVTLKQLFLTSFWSYGSSQIGPTDDMSFFLGPIQLFLGLISLILAIWKKKAFPLLISLLFLMSVFMNHVRSSFIWNMIPLLSYLQFPWRFLISANLFLSLLAGYSFSTVIQEKALKPALFFSLLLLFFNLAYFVPKDWFRITDKEKLSGQSFDQQMTISIFDYLPTSAKYPPADAAPILPKTEDGSMISILDFQRKTNKISFTAISDSDKTLQIPLFDYPGWTVYLDNHKITHQHTDPLGLIKFDLPLGQHEISVKLETTPIRFLGNLLTLFSISITIYFLLIKKNNA